jgi:hypothetical protein
MAQADLRPASMPMPAMIARQQCPDRQPGAETCQPVAFGPPPVFVDQEGGWPSMVDVDHAEPAPVTGKPLILLASAGVTSSRLEVTAGIGGGGSAGAFVLTR